MDFLQLLKFNPEFRINYRIVVKYYWTILSFQFYLMFNFINYLSNYYFFKLDWVEISFQFSKFSLETTSLLAYLLGQ